MAKPRAQRIDERRFDTGMYPRSVIDKNLGG
jgi:hypothetical protein